MGNEIFVTRSSMPSKEEFIEEIDNIWDTHWVSNMMKNITNWKVN